MLKSFRYICQSKQILYLSVVLLLELAAEGQGRPMILKPESFRHYVDYFNKMEEENIKQAIPNDSAWVWMKKNIPLSLASYLN